MNVLLTGATGFIGSAVLRSLIARGCRIVAISRNAPLLERLYPGRLTVIAGDLTDWGALQYRLDLASAGMVFDACIHLAARLDFYAPPAALNKVNVIPTENLADWCRSHNVSRFIFASSIEASGPVSGAAVPAAEESEAMPVSAYGVSKLRAERALLSEAAGKTVTYILRLGNVYGPGSGFLLPAIARSMKFRTALTTMRYAWNSFVYNPVYIDDAVSAIILACLGQAQTSGLYNICGSEIVTLEELYRKIAVHLDLRLSHAVDSRWGRRYLSVRKEVFKYCGLCDTITYLLSGMKDTGNRAYSIKKAGTFLGFDPKINLTEGIKRTLKHEDRNR